MLCSVTPLFGDIREILLSNLIFYCNVLMSVDAATNRTMQLLYYVEGV